MKDRRAWLPAPPYSLEEARGEFQQEGHEAFRLLGLAMVWHSSGRRTESDAELRELIEKDAADGTYQIALGFAYLGETDLASNGWSVRTRSAIPVLAT